VFAIVARVRSKAPTLSSPVTTFGGAAVIVVLGVVQLWRGSHTFESKRDLDKRVMDMAPLPPVSPPPPSREPEMPETPETNHQRAATACEDKNAKACTIAGDQARTGHGTPASPERAVSFYNAACQLAASRCFDLATSAAQGYGRKADPAIARELYGRACDAGAADACSNLGEMMNRGLGGRRDAATAIELFQRACEGGSETGCKNVETFGPKAAKVPKEPGGQNMRLPRAK
jgi:hypothetical protein